MSKRKEDCKVNEVEEEHPKKKILKLEDTIEKESDEKRFGRVLKAIIQARDAQQIEGVYGRLGDLGTIDAKYDVAISTAASRSLDNILVENLAAVKACVNLIQNIGTASFMPLDHMHIMNKQVQTPEGVPRLFDLVTVNDERFKPAFFQALGDTVVANDFDQAARIAFGGNKEFRRVVTLDGTLFQGSAIISGGCCKSRGGKMRTTIKKSLSPEATVEKKLMSTTIMKSPSPEAVASVEKKLEMLHRKTREFEQRLDEIRLQYQAFEALIGRAEMMLEKCEKKGSESPSELKQLDSSKVASDPKKDN